MKAVLIREFGSSEVLRLEEVDKPAVSSDEVLIRVHYSSVNPVDWKIRNGSLKFIHGSKFPMALGFDVAGEIIEIGDSATRFKKGNRVFGMLDYKRRGAYAQYVCAKEENIAIIPENLDFKEAAAIPLAGLTAYQALHYRGKIKGGESVLINGASGGVGSFGVQITKAAGTIVTAVCGTDNIELVKTLGADKIIDYRKKDFTKLPDKYDIIFDAVGKLSFLRVSKNLKDTGRYITTLPDKVDVLSFFLTSFLTLFGYTKKSTFIGVKPSGSDLDSMSSLIKEKKLIPVIDRVFTLNQIREAHAYSETGHARGKIVIKVF